jgi:AcrR family transcriptional regulator
VSTARQPAAVLPFRRTRVEDRATAGRDAVVISQRGRIIEGAVEAAAAKGYAATTLTDIVSRARVSRTTFYEHFANKEQCFLEAIDLATTLLNTQINAAIDTAGDDWRQALRAMVDTYCAVIAAEPEFSLVWFTADAIVGEAARAARDRGVKLSVAHFRALHALARDSEPDLPQVSEDQLLLLFEGIFGHARRVVTDNPARLPTYASAYVEFIRRTLCLPGEVEAARNDAGAA